MDVLPFLRWLAYPCNVCSFARLALVAIALQGDMSPACRVLLLALAWALDAVDGHLARMYGHESPMGAVLDLVVDMTSHVAVAWLAFAHTRAWPLAALCLSLEAAVAALFAFGSPDSHWKARLVAMDGGWTAAFISAYFGNNQRNAWSLWANAAHFLLPALALVDYAPPLPLALVLAVGVAMYELVTVLVALALLPTLSPLAMYAALSLPLVLALRLPLALCVRLVLLLVPRLDRTALAHVAFWGLFYAECNTLIALLHGETVGSNDVLVQAVEERLFGSQMSITLRALLPSPLLGELLHFAYLAFHPFLLLAVLSGGGRVAARLDATYVSCFLLWLLFPVAGPLVSFGAPPPADVGLALPALVQRLGRAGASTGTALPSAHCALSVSAAWTLGSRPAQLLAALIVVATVWTGMHYLVDALAALVVVAVVHRMSPKSDF